MEIQLVPVDIMFGILILGASVRGASKGFITEAVSVASFVCGLSAAIVFHRVVASYLADVWGDSRWNSLVAFLLIFVAVYVLARILEGILHRFFEALRLERLDRVLGLMLGTIEGVLVVAVVIAVMLWQPFLEIDGLLDHSTVVRVLTPYLHSLADFNLPSLYVNDV